MQFIMIDLSRIIIQITLCIYTISLCIKYIKKKQAIMFVTLYCAIMFFLNINFRYTSISNIIEHIIILIFIYAIFYSDRKNAIISISIYYIMSNVFILISIILIKVYLERIIFIENKLVIFSRIFLLVYLFFVWFYIAFIKKIKKIYNRIQFHNEMIKGIIAASFITDFVISFYRSQIFDKHIIFQQFLIVLIQVFFFIAVICLFNIYRRLSINYQLLRELDDKNKELGRIKNNHADILIHINNLYELGYKNQVGEILKSIINGKELIIENKNNYSNNSVIYIITNKLENSGIKVYIDEKSDLSLCKMNELDIYQVINNIVNNAIRVLENQKEKMVGIRINKHLDKLMIEISNNGPKIDEKLKKKIFQTGFTTKKNEDCSHGYGLSIVKELIENHNGSIEIESTDYLTIFRILLPCK